MVRNGNAAKPRVRQVVAHKASGGRGLGRVTCDAARHGCHIRNLSHRIHLRDIPVASGAANLRIAMSNVAEERKSGDTVDLHPRHWLILPGILSKHLYGRFVRSDGIVARHAQRRGGKSHISSFVGCHMAVFTGNLSARVIFVTEWNGLPGRWG